MRVSENDARFAAAAATVPVHLRHRLRVAARCLANGGIVAYPTEAVFGLGCDPMNEAAVMRILEIKGRARSKGLILIAADPAQLAGYVEPLGEREMERILASWPGPNTWIMPALVRTPPWLTGRFDSLAVRVTDHPLAAGLCRAFGGAIVSTSANRADHPPARDARRVRLALGDGPDYVLAGACGGSARPSTIRDARTGRVLRA